MESYNILVEGDLLTIYPQNDGTYKVCKGNDKIADIFPDVVLTGVVWETGDLISKEYAQAIGEAIERSEK